jgi:hypothetical protein
MENQNQNKPIKLHESFPISIHLHNAQNDFITVTQDEVMNELISSSQCEFRQ